MSNIFAVNVVTVKKLFHIKTSQLHPINLFQLAFDFDSFWEKLLYMDRLCDVYVPDVSHKTLHLLQLVAFLTRGLRICFPLPFTTLVLGSLFNHILCCKSKMMLRRPVFLHSSRAGASQFSQWQSVLTKCTSCIFIWRVD